MKSAFHKAMRVVTVSVFVASSVALIAAPALAHAELISTSPDDGEVLAKAPDAVVLTYAEEVIPQGSGIVVTGPDGKRYDIADTLKVGGTEASIQLKPSSVDGRYDVSYRIVAEDGHVGSGALSYTIDQSANASPTVSSSTTPDSSGESDGGGSTVWVLGLAAIGVILVIAVIAVFTRGRRG